MTRGLLLTHIGTPSAPTPTAVRAYLKRFLSDQRIVRLPRLLWLPLLYGWILPRRSVHTAALYQKIWMPHGGSPLFYHLCHLKQKLHAALNQPVALGMHYSAPSIAEGLATLQQQGVTHAVILPLFPQASLATTAVTEAFVRQVLAKNITLTGYTLAAYATNQHYIAALVETVRHQSSFDHLLISFHGLPKHMAKKDRYREQCEATAQAVATALKLTATQWTLCYQSRIGMAPWLQPSLTHTLMALPSKGVKCVAVICPGFAVDCLETLEEVVLRGTDTFLKAGGEQLHYIPALNASEAQVDLLASLVHSESRFL